MLSYLGVSITSYIHFCHNPIIIRVKRGILGREVGGLLNIIKLSLFHH